MMTETMILMAAMLGDAPAPDAAPTAAPAIISPTSPTSPASISAHITADLTPGAITDTSPGVVPVALAPSAFTHILPVPGATSVRVAAADDAAADIVRKVQTFYTKTKTLSAKFRQIVTNKVFGDKRVSDGRVWIKKPGKMRWDYKGKKLAVEKSFISDGTTLWAVEHDNKQAATRSLKETTLPVAVTFLYGKGDLMRDFSPKLDNSGRYGKKSDYVLELTPRIPSAQYKKLYLVVDRSDYRVKQSIVINASGESNHFMFFEPNTKRPVKDSWFTFNPSAHRTYRLVKPDELKRK